MTNSDEPVLDVPKDASAAARSRAYALLAEAFTYPQGSPVIRLLDGDWLADLSEALEALPYTVDGPFELITPRSKTAIVDMQVIYARLFDVTSGTPMISLLERRYGEIPEQRLWEDLLSFYRHFGLDFSQGTASEQPDHLLTELAFMHYLSFLEAGTTGDKGDFQRGQRDFLKIHLGVWVDDLANRLGEIEHPHPYVGLGILLANFVSADLGYLDQCLPAVSEGGPEGLGLE